jgi:cellobiose phosphorylase
VTSFGHFDDARCEYVVERPDTPLPWINYLGSEAYVALVSSTGGGYSFHRDARLRRLTRYRYNGAPADQDGRHLYLRDDADGDAWAPSWRPMRRDLDAFECRHGLGYSIVSSRRRGIAVETTFTVPLGEDRELWRVQVTNERNEPATLSLFGAVEFCLWDALDDMTNFQRNLSTGEVEVREGVILHTTERRERRDHVAWFGCSAPVAGFDTARDAFLGPYRGWDNPAAVEAGACAGSIAHGWAPIAAQHLRLDLAPGETTTVLFALGYAEGDAPIAVPAIDAVDDALAALRRHWSSTLGRLQVATPDEHVDRMVNTWNAYQCMVTFNVSRSASMFESGIGRGMGFRDCCQDLLGFVHLVPERARERLLDLAATQLPTGGAHHQYQPLTKRGNDAIGGGFNDDQLWLVLAAAAYVKETGDRSVLDAPVPYDSEPGTESPLLEHLERAVGYTLDRLGPHGLPLIGRADWNDCLNLNCFSTTPGESFQTTTYREGGVAESVLIAALLVVAADELAALGLDGYAARADAMRATVGEHGWDGEWFLRAYDHDGTPVGSAANDEGRIYVETQGLCVLAGIGLDDGRAAQALDAVDDHLVTPHGAVLVDPPYTRYRVELGEISSYPPGYKENGSVFCHTNPWLVVAAAMLGDGDRALAHHLRINPSAREAISDVHRSEPYVYAQTIAGRAAATPGEAKNSWLTGTASWSYVAATQWLLGVRPEHDGLRVAPALPSTWEGFRVQRAFRGATYDVDVRRGDRDEVLVDGVAIAGDVVPPAAPGATVRVEVTVH